jgi:2'-hydroxyisoflavone reductase
MNAVGPKGGLPIGKLLDACKEAAKSEATFTFVPDDFLEAQKIGEWSDLPAWVSPRKPGGGVAAVSIERALKAGLTFRSPVETARDTLQWYRDTKRKASFPFTKEREAAALVAWHDKQKAGGGVKKS